MSWRWFRLSRCFSLLSASPSPLIAICWFFWTVRRLVKNAHSISFLLLLDLYSSWKVVTKMAAAALFQAHLHDWVFISTRKLSLVGRTMAAEAFPAASNRSTSVLFAAGLRPSSETGRSLSICLRINAW